MTIAVEVEDPAWTNALPGAEAIVERAALLTLSHLSARGSGDPALSSGAQAAKTWVPASAGMSGVDFTVLLTSDAVVRDLNARFRGKDAATNVLSFPAPDFARPHLGDVALAFGVCAHEAQDQAKSLADHLSHLTVHGVLHLLGYDHEADGAAEVMEQMERAILKDLGVRDPYAQGPHA